MYERVDRKLVGHARTRHLAREAANQPLGQENLNHFRRSVNYHRAQTKSEVTRQRGGHYCHLPPATQGAMYIYKEKTADRGEILHRAEVGRHQSNAPSTHGRSTGPGLSPGFTHTHTVALNRTLTISRRDYCRACARNPKNSDSHP